MKINKSADFLSKSISLYVTVNGVNSNVYIGTLVLSYHVPYKIPVKNTGIKRNFDFFDFLTEIL